MSLTPAEASHSGHQAAAEGALRPSENALTLQKFKNNQKLRQQELIDSILRDISPNEGSAARDVQEAAKKSIAVREDKLKNRAAPYYKASESQQIDQKDFDGLMEDSNIKSAYKQLRKSTLYKSELKGVDPTSIKTLDLVKKRIDAKIAKAKEDGDKDAVRILTNAKHTLLESLDEISPDYKRARAIYSEESPTIDLLRKGKVGKLAKLPEDQLKNISKYILDPQETDINVLRRTRNHIREQNPDAWNGIVRNEMERLIENKAVDPTGNHGSNFYTQVLSKEKTYRNFQEALEGNAKAKETMQDMRTLFKDLLNSYTPKTKAGFGQTGVDQQRSSGGYLEQIYSKLVGNLFDGNYDDVAAKLITDDKWQPYFLKIMNKENASKAQKNQDALKFLDAISKGGIYGTTQDKGK